MTPEEYKRIKEAEKEHLLALKKLKTQLRQVKQQNSVAEAMKNIENAPGDEIARTHEEMVDRLAMETIQGEARLEVALSDSGEIEDETTAGSVVEENTVEGTAHESIEDQEQKIVQSDAELQKLRAQELVRQVKLQMGLANVKKKQNHSSTVNQENSSDEDESNDTEKGKTLDSTPQGDLPERTIGRIPRKKS